MLINPVPLVVNNPAHRPSPLPLNNRLPRRLPLILSLLLRLLGVNVRVPRALVPMENSLKQNVNVVHDLDFVSIAETALIAFKTVPLGDPVKPLPESLRSRSQGSRKYLRTLRKKTEQSRNLGKRPGLR